MSVFKEEENKSVDELATTPFQSILKKADAIRKAVRDTYAGLAATDGSKSSCCSGNRCCGTSKKHDFKEYAKQLGYADAEAMLGEESGSNLGLGCGNPTAIASLKKGEVVLDLGSGAGFDCFLAARQVGDAGRVIGLDMTEEMLVKARSNAEKQGISNVEFVHGTIEEMPIPDNSVDVVISNCVINLSPDKAQVLREVFLVLRPGGRFTVSDVIATREIPQCIRDDLSLYTGCMAGAVTVEKLTEMLFQAGLSNIQIDIKEDSKSYIGKWAPGSSAEDYVASAYITAYK